MIDTDKYEGHSTGWKLKMNYSSATIWNDEGHKVATTHYYDSPSNRHDRFIIEDSLKLLAEVKRLREELDRVTKQCGALWSITNNWSMCEDDYTMHDQYENLDERYAYHDDGFIILKEMWTLTEEDGWLPNEELEGEEE